MDHLSSLSQLQREQKEEINELKRRVESLSTENTVLKMGLSNQHDIFVDLDNPHADFFNFPGDSLVINEIQEQTLFPQFLDDDHLFPEQLDSFGYLSF